MRKIIKRILKEQTEVQEKLLKLITKSNKRVITDLGGVDSIKKIFGNYDFYTPEFLEKLINNELDFLKEKSEDWGLGEMDEYNEINSVEKIKVVNLVKVSKIKVYVDIYTLDRDDFDNLRAEIQYRLEEEWNPKIEIYINEIKNTDTLNESKVGIIKNFIQTEVVDNVDIICDVFVEKDSNEYIITIRIIGGYGTKYFPRTQYINRIYNELYDEISELMDNYIPIPHKIYFEYVQNCNDNILDESKKFIQTESISDIKSVLRLGSVGDNVTELQKTLGIYQDGKFGKQTEKCVKEFQRIEPKIQDDGIVGPETIDKLKKLENGKITWSSPDFCKIQKKIKNDLSDEIKSDVDVILMCGLDYRPGDKTISQQVQLLKRSTGNKNIIGFKYNAPSEVKSAILKNPNAYVVLFSAGCKFSSEIASAIKDKKKLFIVEPYASSEKTKQSVINAISQGVPNQNVITGPEKNRGFGVISNSTPTPNGIGHWGALEYVGKFIK